MIRLLIDTNLILDVLLERAPFVDASATIWRAAERGEIKALLSAHAVTTIHYLIRKEHGDSLARRSVADLLQVFDVAAVDGSVLLRATQIQAPDFEDSVTAAAAEKAKCRAIISRDRGGFRNSSIEVLSPEVAPALWTRN